MTSSRTTAVSGSIPIAVGRTEVSNLRTRPSSRASSLQINPNTANNLHRLPSSSSQTSQSSLGSFTQDPPSSASASYPNIHQRFAPATPASSSSLHAPSFEFSFAPTEAPLSPMHSVSATHYGPPSSIYSAYSESPHSASPSWSRRGSLTPSLAPLSAASDNYFRRSPSNASSTGSLALSFRASVQRGVRRFSSTASLRSSHKGDESDADDGWGSTFEDDWEGCATGGGSRRASFASSLGRRSSSGWLKEVARKSSLTSLSSKRRESDVLPQSLLSPTSLNQTFPASPVMRRKSSLTYLAQQVPSARARRSSLTRHLPIIGSLPQTLREIIALFVFVLAIFWSFSTNPLTLFRTRSDTTPLRRTKVDHHPITHHHIAANVGNAGSFPLLSHEHKHHKSPIPAAAVFHPPKNVHIKPAPPSESMAPEVLSSTLSDFFWDDPRDELGSLIHYIVSSPSHTLSANAPPNHPLDPQSVLDFSPTSPDAQRLIAEMVDNLFFGRSEALGLAGKLILVGDSRNEPTQTILSLLESLEVSPSPYLLDLGDRSDVRTLTPLFARMMGHGGHLPSLIVNGEVVGDYEAIARLQQSPANADNFYDVLSKANITFVDPSLAVYGGYTSDDEDDEEDGDHDESRE